MAVADKLSALRIKANLIADKSVGLMEIDAEVHDGVAILRGEVETEDQKNTAEELAYEVEGIEEVQNEIQVVEETKNEMPPEFAESHLGYGLVEGDAGDTAFGISGKYAGPGPGIPSTEQFPGEFTDDQIEAEIQEKLDSRTEVDTSKVKFCSANQIVYLKGKINTPEDLNNLQEIILNVRGVMGIRSEIDVEEGEIGTPNE